MTSNDAVYFCFPSGNFLMGDKKLDTDTDSKKTPVTDQLSFAAIDDPNINDMYRIYATTDSDWKSENDMFKELFPDYTGASTRWISESPLVIKRLHPLRRQQSSFSSYVALSITD